MKRRSGLFWGVTVLPALLAAAGLCTAETVYRLADLKDDPAPVGAPRTDGREVFVGAGVILFAGADAGNGLELWRSDGAAASTGLLMDINPGRNSSNPGGMVALGPWVYFFADDGVRGFELWRTDGTTARTELVADICPGSCDGLPGRYGGARSRRFATPLGDELYFTGNDGTHGWELWRTDGTPAGTSMVVDLWPGGYGTGPLELTVLDGVLYFSTADAGPARLWRSDGSAAGTTVVAELGPDQPYSGIEPSGLVALGHTLYFTLWHESYGTEVWKSDGTEAGTGILKDICPGTCGGIGTRLDGTWLKSWRGAAYFAASAPETGVELWRTDGTSGGTVLVGDLNPGPANSLDEFMPLGDTLLLAVDDGVHGTELWIGDGTPAGSRLVHDYYPGRTGAGIGSFVTVGRMAYFKALGGLWRTDGTPGGTTIIFVPSAPPSGSSALEPIAPFDGMLLFLASTADGAGLMLTNGIRGGQRAVAIALPLSIDLPGAYPDQLTPMAGGLAFVAGRPERWLWYTDPAPGSVVSLSPSGLYVGAAMLTPVGSTLFFSQGTYGLWKTDLSARTPALAYPRPPWTSGPRAAATLGDSVMVSDEVGQGPALYRLAAGASDVQLVRDLCSDGCDDLIASMTPFGDRLLFTAVHFGSSEGAVWITDGAAAGTVELARLGARDYMVEYDYGLVAGAGRAYFTAARASTGNELWTTDGTPAGSRMVADLCPGSCDGVPPPMGAWAATRHRAIALDGERLFFVADDGVHGSELWVTDGTTASTRLVVDLTAGPGSSAITWLTGAGSGAFFVFDDGEHGLELWHSDGTAGGTALVEDINLGSRSGAPQHLVWSDDVLLFAATDGVRGLEPWRSDGTPNATRQIADIVPGPGSSSPQQLVRSGSCVYFRAYDDAGFELWAIELDGNARARRRLPRT